MVRHVGEQHRAFLDRPHRVPQGAFRPLLQRRQQTVHRIDVAGRTAKAQAPLFIQAHQYVVAFRAGEHRRLAELQNLGQEALVLARGLNFDFEVFAGHGAALL